MRFSPLNMSALDNPSRLYRRELQGRYLGLRFAAAVEKEFVDFLRETQARNVLFCIWMGLVLWLGVACWDVVRYVQGIEGTAMEALFLKLLLPARLASLLALTGLLVGMRRRLWGRWQHVACLVTVSVYCITGFVTGYLYYEMGLANAMAASILILMAVFFPCGLAFREAMPAAGALLVAYLLAGWWTLSPAQWSEFWGIASLLVLCTVMMAFSSYLRERGAREQFLLRRLLDWEAGHDPLTGLANRRSFQKHFEICLAQARRDGKALLLVILDLDHFKLYNDHYGHKAGDRALQQVALVLEHYAARPMDLAIRLGGEEFGLLSYADDAQALKLRMQHLLAQLQGLQISHEFSPTATCLTASIGIAQAEATGTTDSLFQQADAQLYRAKKAGRNQVCGPDMGLCASAAKVQVVA